MDLTLRIFLTMVFVLLVVPLATLLRILRIDPLGLRFDRAKTSYLRPVRGQRSRPSSHGTTAAGPIVDVRQQLAPQMLDYDRMGSNWLPYLMFFHPQMLSMVFPRNCRNLC